MALALPFEWRLRLGTNLDNQNESRSGPIKLKISIVTAVFNRASTIEHSIASVRSQLGCDWEHVIQDGGSTDGTLEIISPYGGGIQLESRSDGGIYDALNRGIARSTGDVVGLLHSDDYFAHEHVLAHVASAFSQRKVDGVYGDLDYVAQNDPTSIVRHWVAGAFRTDKLRRGWMPPHPTLFMRREVFDRLGSYDTSYRIAADYEAFLRWTIGGNLSLAYLPEVLVKMRIGGASNGSIHRIIAKSIEDYRAIRSNRVGGVGVLLAKNIVKLPQLWRR